MHSEIGGDLLDRYTVIAVASDPDDVVAELAGVGPCHGDILPARPCWASQLRCHLFVQQTPPCDRCSQESPPWTTLADHLVPDPELLVNAELTVLQAIAWASSYRRGSYGEASLRAAVLGKESLGEGRPLGAGVLSCPQFGALRHVRNGEKRWHEALNKLLSDGLVERRIVERESSRSSYDTLSLTSTGAQTLGIAVSHND
ncbi:hypothetical protein MKCMC460_36630 [Mycobacterium sp. 20KCMC460]|nr:hypothetical protein MKCMC460_36630 [Mycobacterium sp. 20KCMC460]